MSMTRHDYDRIAGAILEQWRATVDKYGKGEQSFLVHATALRIADALEVNDNFDRAVFLQKAGVAE